MSSNPTVRTEFHGDVAWVTIDNPPVNATSTTVREGLAKAVSDVAGARVAILICAGKTFVAGGDMTEFDAPAVEPLLPDVVQMIEDSPAPFVAAMHGTVLGGGFEIAMACAWRVAVSGTRFGLPEVNVGIIPGAGGSQRLPRLVGMEAAIEIACLGRMINATRLQELGGLDVIATGDLRKAVLDFVENLPKRPDAVSRRNFDGITDEKLAQWRVDLTKRAKGQKSPLENLVALAWANLPFEQGQPLERARHLELRHSAESRALRHSFFAERQVRKPAAIKGAEPGALGQIVVVGGGLMGAGIATAALISGLGVVMVERDAATAMAGRERVEGLLEGALKRGKVTAEKHRETLKNFGASDDYSDAASADLAIEAVFEDVDVKREVFRKLSAAMAPDAILATNTSYLDPSLIFAGIDKPSRCIGLHFFSPAHIMKLLEIIHLPETDRDVLATGFALAKRLNKTPVLSGICDGFIGNRMLAAYRRAADYLLADGALPQQVDAAMREFGMPMGPYELQDLTGLQISWANRKRQAPTRDPNERYVPFGDQLCEQGHLGQRSGQGWYKYSKGSRTPETNPDVQAMILEYANAQGIKRREFTALDIQSRLMAVLTNEGVLIVQEGIAENAAAVDIVQISGYGYPRWRGGPMQYASEIGWDVVTKSMGLVNSESPGSWQEADFDGFLKGQKE